MYKMRFLSNLLTISLLASSIGTDVMAASSMSVNDADLDNVEISSSLSDTSVSDEADLDSGMNDTEISANDETSSSNSDTSVSKNSFFCELDNGTASAELSENSAFSDDVSFSVTSVSADSDEFDEIVENVFTEKSDFSLQDCGIIPFDISFMDILDYQQ